VTSAVKDNNGKSYAAEYHRTNSNSNNDNMRTTKSVDERRLNDKKIDNILLDQ
jgi:hypothetical protein